MKLRSGKRINETTKSNDMYWVNNMLKHYSDLLREVHNENLEEPNEIYWEEMSRVLTESYYILNQEFKNLYDCDRNHRNYLLNLEPQACRSIQILHDVIESQKTSDATLYALECCIDEMTEFVEKVRVCIEKYL
jgi:hypothetical protein